MLVGERVGLQLRLSSGASRSGSGGGSSSGSSSGGVRRGGASSSGSGSSSSSGGVADAGDLVASLLALTASCTAGSASAVATPTQYHSEGANPVNVPICKLNGALFWNSGMNIDCDGQTTTHCPGTGSDEDCCYQPTTAFDLQNGMPLSAENTPYVVIPDNFKYAGLDTTNGGNVFAVIYKVAQFPVLRRQKSPPTSSAKRRGPPRTASGSTRARRSAGSTTG